MAAGGPAEWRSFHPICAAGQRLVSAGPGSGVSEWTDAVLEKHLPRARCRYLYLYLRNTSAASFSDRSQPGVTLPLQFYLVIISLQRHDR